jgi:hypothetical protein
MLKPHRLVGWWLSGGLVALAAPAIAQSSAAFPEDPPPSVTPAPPRAPTAPAPAPALPPPPAPARPVAAPAYPPPLPPVPVAAPAAPAAPVAGSQSPVPRDGDPRPPILPYRDGFPVPPGYEVVKRPATGLLAGGLVGLGIAYGTGVVFAAVNGFENGTGWLAVPIVGPWGAIGSRNYETCRTRTVAEAKACVRNAVKEVQVITFFAVDGIGQLAGGLVTLAGLVSSKEELVRTDLVEKVQVSVLPPVQGSPWAVSVSGQF